MSTFDEDLFLKGLEQRKATLGADYVEGNLAAAKVKMVGVMG
jgi:4-carboxymuconolactone decarboxylase|tara:strand:- start:1733 stop:1858 length:126 start_codon:yes stop_codon:yes gene_type:complete